MNIARRLWQFVIVALAAAACSKSQRTPDCSSSLVESFKQARARVKVPPNERANVDDALTALRDAALAQCKSQGWSAAAITCVETSKSADDVKQCAKQFTDAQLRSLTTDTAAAWISHSPESPSFGSPPYSQAALDSLDEAAAQLHDATRVLTEAGLHSDPRTTEIEDAIKRARQRALLNEAEDPEMPFADAVRRAKRLALRYRVETALPAVVLTRDPSPAGP